MQCNKSDNKSDYICNKLDEQTKRNLMPKE